MRRVDHFVTGYLLWQEVTQGLAIGCCSGLFFERGELVRDGLKLGLVRMRR